MPEFGGRLGNYSGWARSINWDWHVAALDRTSMDQEFAREIHQIPLNRRQLIFRVRRQIAEGTYDTPEKLDLAFDRLLADFPGDDRTDRDERED